MIHYTLNTAHSAHSPRSGVSTEAIEALAPLVERGSGSLPADFSAFSVQITQGEGGAVFTIFRAGAPIVTAGIAWLLSGAAEVWPGIEKLYNNGRSCMKDQKPGPGRPSNDEESAVGHIHMRVTMERKNSYVRAARCKKLKLTEWIVETCDKAAAE